jgi:hypothetical protein
MLSCATVQETRIVINNSLNIPIERFQSNYNKVNNLPVIIKGNPEKYVPPYYQRMRTYYNCVRFIDKIFNS